MRDVLGLGALGTILGSGYKGEALELWSMGAGAYAGAGLEPTSFETWNYKGQSGSWGLGDWPDIGQV